MATLLVPIRFRPEGETFRSPYGFPLSSHKVPKGLAVMETISMDTPMNVFDITAYTTEKASPIGREKNKIRWGARQNTNLWVSGLGKPED